MTQPGQWKLPNVNSRRDHQCDIDEAAAEAEADESSAGNNGLPPVKLSCRAVLCRGWTALCCCLVDRILRLPPETPARPQLTRYRRSWHSLASLLAALVCLTVCQTCASGVAFAYCVHQLGGCAAFLERDPCLKTMVPFFVVSLVWLSVFCSCCCQSPKALSVFLLVGLCGEAVLGSYMVAFDRSVRIDDHLSSHLTESLQASSCFGRGKARSNVDDDVESRGDAARCFGPFRTAASTCQRLDRRSPAAGCNASGERTVESLNEEFRLQTESCIAEVLLSIAAKKQSYQTLTYSLLYMFAVAHLFIALAVCVYDVRRKREEKRLGGGRRLQLLAQSDPEGVIEEAAAALHDSRAVKSDSKRAATDDQVLINRAVHCEASEGIAGSPAPAAETKLTDVGRVKFHTTMRV